MFQLYQLRLSGKHIVGLFSWPFEQKYLSRNLTCLSPATKTFLLLTRGSTSGTETGEKGAERGRCGGTGWEGQEQWLGEGRAGPAVAVDMLASVLVKRWW